MIEIASEPITRDAIVAAVATIVTAVVAVVAGYRGAQQGATATREATERGVVANLTAAREARAEQQRDARNTALLSLQSELRINAQIATDPGVMWYSVPFETGALSQSLPFLGTVSPSTRQSIENVWRIVLQYNTLVRGGAVASGPEVTRISREARTLASSAVATFIAVANALDAEIPG